MHFIFEIAGNYMASETKGGAPFSIFICKYGHNIDIKNGGMHFFIVKSPLPPLQNFLPKLMTCK